jgi:cell division protein ZapE
MDLFFSCTTGPARRRIHFHEFMQDVHRRMHVARKSADANGAILRVARDLAEEAQLLCLDEMQIADIADAMIVGRLFEAMFDQGTVLITTSNLPPGDLYKNGLNRPLFEPFIRLIEQRLEVISLAGPLDYRLNRIKAYETFLTPLGPETDSHLQQLWERLTDTREGEPAQIDVLGRKIAVPQAAKGCARFGFEDLCAKPLGAADYLGLSKEYQAIFVENIPVLGPEQRNEAKRFILLIDTLYDARLKLIASAAAAPERLYRSGDHSAEFARTVSRLLEMQSASWWGHPIAET